jgi:hypothetical protein
VVSAFVDVALPFLEPFSRASSSQQLRTNMSDFAEKTEETKAPQEEEKVAPEGAEEGGEDSNVNPEVRENFFCFNSQAMF